MAARSTVARWPIRLIRMASPLVPAAMRDEWRREWEGELAAWEGEGRGDLTRHAAGAFADAFWLRQRSLVDADWIDDLRHGWRQLRAHALFALTAVLVLAIGIAATVAMFSAVDQVFLRPLPYPRPDELVTVWETRAAQAIPLDVAPGNFIEWRDRARSFARLVAMDPYSVDYTGAGHPEVFFAAKVTEGFFDVFGLPPLAGRYFRPEEHQPGGAKVVVLHEPFWRRRFGADPAIVGSVLQLDGEPYTVLGIAPAALEPRLLTNAAEPRGVFLPKAFEGWEQRVRTSGFWNVAGRLKPGVALEEAQAELTTIARQLEQESPRTHRGSGIAVVGMRDHLVGGVRPAFRLLSLAVALVLLIVCVNVASLLLARGSLRERELAIRSALGAPRGRIVRQLLTESLLVSGIGGAAGVALAQAGLTSLAALGPASVPWIRTLHMDAWSLGFAVLLSAGVALLSGALPAFRAARVSLAAAGRATATAGRATHRLRSALVVAEVAMALVLATGAGLLIRSFEALLNVDPGFDRDRVAVAQVFLRDPRQGAERTRAFVDAVLARVSALPGVEAAGAVSAMPFIEANINLESTLAFPGRPPAAADDAARGSITMATPGYFEALRVPLRQGRLFAAADGPDQPRVAVVSASLAARFLAGVDPIGQHVAFQMSGTPCEAEIIGVVDALRHDALDSTARPELFLPYAQLPFRSMTFVMRTAADPATLLEPAKAAIWAVDPLQAIHRTATLHELVARTVTPRRFAVVLLSAFAGIALLLAAVGLYGVLSAITSARLREMGVRVALGAGAWDVARAVVGPALAIVGVGLAIGLMGALGASGLLRGVLYQVEPLDPIAFGGACALMLFVAILACISPARRAVKANPVEVLRAE